jgi:hypothetical protein
MSTSSATSTYAKPAAADDRTCGVRPLAHHAPREHEPSEALRRALAEADRRLAAAPDPLAHLTRERFEANRAAGIPDTLGVGPRLAPRR